jgi:hypothetical protein
MVQFKISQFIFSGISVSSDARYLHFRRNRVGMFPSGLFIALQNSFCSAVLGIRDYLFGHYTKFGLHFPQDRRS